MIKISSRIFFAVLFVGLINTSFANEELDALLGGLVYDPNKTYAAGSAVMISVSDGEIYTSKIEVPAAADGSNGPNGANADTYWGDSTTTTNQFSADNPTFLNDLPTDINTTELSKQVGSLTNPATTQNAKIVRLSVRGHIGTADDERFMAFSVLGSTEVLVRGIGPTLGDLDSGLAPYSLIDPSLVLINSADDKDMDGFGNDDYTTSSNADEISQLSQTIYPPIPIKSTESASINTFSTGTYYANVRDKQFSSSFGSRIGWVAVDMTDSSASGGFTGVSCRGIVKPADGAMFAAFEIVGNASEKRKIFIRGRGASLASFGVSNTLSNIMLSLYQFDTVNDTTTFLQDNKTYTSQSNSAEIKQNSIDYFPELKISLDDSDPGMIIELSPGYYTVDIESEDGSSGNAWLGVDDITD